MGEHLFGTKHFARPSGTSDEHPWAGRPSWVLKSSRRSKPKKYKLNLFEGDTESPLKTRENYQLINEGSVEKMAFEFGLEGWAVGRFCCTAH